MKNKSILETVEEYVFRYGDEKAYVAPLMDLLSLNTSDMSCRKNFNGHVTASALLMNDNEECLMIHHKSLNKILFPGGHIEPEDRNLYETALRELREESGVAPTSISDSGEIEKIPLDIDHHGIPENKKKAEPAHAHWDMLYLFRLACGEVCNVVPNTHEVTAYSWHAIHDLPMKLQSRLKRLNR